MAVTKITYAADAAVTVTTWGTGLANGEFAVSAVIDNSSSLYVDAYIGGDIAVSTATGGPIVAGDSMDLYVIGQYSDTSTDLTGAIAALLGYGNEEAVDVAFIKANLKLVVSIQVQIATPDTTEDLHYGPEGIAQHFGGVMPKKWAIILHNNTAATLGSGSNLNVVGITYTTA